MSDDAEAPLVVFRVRFGRQEFTCSGRLVWEGGIAFAIPDQSDSDVFVPERARLEESDLELKHDGENGDWYQYHGFIVLPNM